MDLNKKIFIGLQERLLLSSLMFCDVVEANVRAIEPSDFEKVINLTKAAIRAIENMTVV